MYKDQEANSEREGGGGCKGGERGKWGGKGAILKSNQSLFLNKID